MRQLMDAKGRVQKQIARSPGNMIGAIPALYTNLCELHWCNGSTGVLAKVAAAARRRQALQGLSLPWAAGVTTSMRTEAAAFHCC